MAPVAAVAPMAAMGSLTRSGGKGPRPPSCHTCIGVGRDSGSASDLGGGTPAPVPGVNRDAMSCFGRAGAPGLSACGRAAAPPMGSSRNSSAAGSGSSSDTQRWVQRRGAGALESARRSRLETLVSKSSLESLAATTVAGATSAGTEIETGCPKPATMSTASWAVSTTRDSRARGEAPCNHGSRGSKCARSIAFGDAVTTETSTSNWACNAGVTASTSPR
mmetsp:Transcript_4029/g.6697  ORF Transcript_4029/g.6697 Transcript_4029/m.6697 type:complete len:220 (+) Transcript_4029:550-1209(+)